MSNFINRTKIDIESKGITVNCLMEILDIDEVSANELLCGQIAFTRGEIIEIAQKRNIDVEELFGCLA